MGTPWGPAMGPCHGDLPWGPAMGTCHACRQGPEVHVVEEALDSDPERRIEIGRHSFAFDAWAPGGAWWRLVVPGGACGGETQPGCPTCAAV